MPPTEDDERSLGLSLTDSGVQASLHTPSEKKKNRKLSANDIVANIIDRQAEERKIVRALDFHMMPLFCVFYFTDYLDRANIGNATLAGIKDDLQLTTKQLSSVISAFYITYILFEVPSNIVLKKTSATIWLSSIMLAWGIITLAMAFSTNFVSLFICRLLLGAAESGYIPGILYQMSRVYKPRELSLRVAFLLCMASLSGLVSGPLAYMTTFLEGQKGLHDWQYLFIIEGAPTIVLSIFSFLYLFDDIQEVKWLTDEQKALQRLRMQEDTSQEASDVIDRATFVKTFGDWKLWLFSVVYALNAVNMTSIAIFQPIIIDGFGFGILKSQILTAPPSLVSTVMVLAGGFVADRFNRRSPMMVAGFLTTTLGYLLLLVLRDPWALYAALFIIPFGLGFQAPALLGWSAINFPDLNVRALAVAVVVTIGNSGSVVASFLYPMTDGPRYYFGNTFNLACAIMGAIVSGITGYFLYRENTKNQKIFEARASGDITSKENTYHRFYY